MPRARTQRVRRLNLPVERDRYSRLTNTLFAYADETRAHGGDPRA